MSENKLPKPKSGSSKNEKALASLISSAIIIIGNIIYTIFHIIFRILVKMV